MYTEVKINSGRLFELVLDHFKNSVDRKDVINLVAKSNGKREWIILRTKRGVSYLMDHNEIRKCRLKYLINKIKKVTN